ncbi:MULTISPECIES: DUF5067 domain-containing protein [unclassified Oceanobacillus]|uniref:DUF5067 domain-containing protein n=1 Tax=unclassified Oceanobacillus TaxID=2630292 RepID=UPI00300E511B
MSKKWLGLLIAGLLVLSACGDTNNESGQQEENAEPETNDVAQNEEIEEAEEEQEEEVEVEESSGNEIVLGEPINVGEYEMTIQSYSLGVDYDGKDALIIEYDWVNNSDESASPFMTFMLKGFQDGVETDEVFMVDDVDLSIGQKEVRPGGSIEGAQDIVGIDDLSKPLELELDELMSFESNPYLVEIDLSTLE